MLNSLANIYPRYTTKIFDAEVSEADLTNLWYLKEQGLVEGDLEMSITQDYIFGGVKITAKGLDFLADDGGISAILGTVVVRLHTESIKELLLMRIEASDASTEKKSWLKQQIETASSETIKNIVGLILDQGVQQAPRILHWMEQAIQVAKNAT